MNEDSQRSTDYRERLRNLTPAQLAHLARSLDERTASTEGSKTPAQLVAYVATKSATKQDLQRHIDSLLPKHMSPSSYVVLDQLPRTANGKVDRRLLSQRPNDLFTEDDQRGAPKTLPRDETEKAIADIWAEVLNQRNLGVHDNFYESGGDSLMSIRILAIARQRGLQISTEQFFDHPTIAGQASLAKSVVAATDASMPNGRPSSDQQDSDHEPAATSSPEKIVPLVELDQAELDKIASVFEDHDASEQE